MGHTVKQTQDGMTSLLLLLLLSLLLPFCSPLPTANYSANQGLLIVGGKQSETTVEFWSPNMHCNLPSLDRQMIWGPTVDYLNGKVVACWTSSCDKFEGGSWTPLHDTLEDRDYHSSTVVGDKVLLMGGVHSRYTTELMPVDGGSSQPGFEIDEGRASHCSIRTGEDSIMFTGGEGVMNLVREYKGIGSGGEVTFDDYPALNTNREEHACGMYEKGGHQMLIVVGGRDSFEYISTSEVYDYSQGTSGSWRLINPLVWIGWGARGANINGVFHIAGGFYGQFLDHILAWDPQSETFREVGKMNVGKEFAGVAAVSAESVVQYCH